MQIAYPETFLNGAVTEDGTVDNKFAIIFVPQIIETPSSFDIESDDGALVSNIKTKANSTINAGAGITGTKGLTITNTTQEDFEKRLKKNVTTKNETLYIALPLKPFTISVGHNWSMETSVQSEGAIDILTQKAKGGISAVSEGIRGEDLVKTQLNQIGINKYEPQRQFFQNDDPIALEFEWTMVPKNEKEADSIRKIIKAFQYYSTTQSPKDQNKGLKFFSKTPAIWEIDFSNEDKFKDMIVHGNKFKHMVCTSVGVNMGGENDFWSAFKDGFPNQITLTLAFTQYFSTTSANLLYGDVPKLLGGE